MNKYRIYNKSILIIISLLISFTSLTSQTTTHPITLSDNTQLAKSNVKTPLFKAHLSDTIFIHNAGLVLLHPYLITLLERAGYTNENKFLNSTSQAAAIYLLQYAATGEERSPEHLLTLNKLLCGTAIDQLTKDKNQLSEQNKILVESMLLSLLNNWPIMSNSSIENLRGAFLLRDGFLIEQEDKWVLKVESKSYDIVLDFLPYNYSPINLPWMNKPLHVNWR